MMPASDSGAGLVGDHAHGVVERVGLAVERGQGLAGAGAAHREMAAHLGGVEHVQRPAAIESDEIGDVDQRIDRPQADGGEAALQPWRRRPVVDAADQPQRKAAAERRRGAEVERRRARGREGALHRLDRRVLERADVGGGEVARDAVHAGAVGAVGRQVDLDHRIVEAGPARVACADRRIVRQLDDAVVIVGQLQLGFRAQHAAALDAADGADAERHVLARNEGAGRRRTRPSCRRGHWARRTRPAPDRRRRYRPCRPAAGRHWDAARPRSRAR